MIGERSTVVTPWRALRRNHGGPHEEIVSVLLSLVGTNRTLIVCDIDDIGFATSWLVRAGFDMRSTTLEERSAFDVTVSWLNGGHGEALYYDTDVAECARLARFGAGTLCVTFGAWEPDHIAEPRSWTVIEAGHQS